MSNQYDDISFLELIKKASSKGILENEEEDSFEHNP